MAILNGMGIVTRGQWKWNDSNTRNERLRLGQEREQSHDLKERKKYSFLKKKKKKEKGKEKGKKEG